jgi:hypothetical protein
MLCPLCHGHRLFFYQGQLLPCPECEGQGEIHCCDGLQEQADDSADGANAPPGAEVDLPQP